MDNVLNSLGWRGRYQKMQFILYMVPFIDCSLHLVSFIFIGIPFPHKCAELDFPHHSLSTNSKGSLSSTGIVGDVNSTLSVTYSACSITVTKQSQVIYKSICINGYEYETPRERSFAAEWDLVCEKSALPEVTQTIFTGGMMTGAFMFAALSDKYGRRPIHLVSHTLFFAVAVVTALMPNYTSFVWMRFLLGAMQQGIATTSGVALLELIPTKKRAMAIQASIVAWSIGLLLVVVVSYLCRELSWQHTQLVLASFSIYCLIQFCLNEESIRWLAANNKHEDAEELIRKAAKANGVDPRVVLRLYRDDTPVLYRPPRSPVIVDSYGTSMGANHQNELMFGGDDARDDEPEAAAREPQRPSADMKFSAFFRNRRIFLRTIIVFYIWFSDNVAYVGLLLLSSSLVNDLYLGFALSVFAEIPAAIAFIVLINRYGIGRRQLSIASHLLGGICLMIAVLLSKIPAAAGMPGAGVVVIVVSLVGKFGVCLGFNCMWLYTPELFPTTIRSTALGIASSAARIGGMVAPFSIILARHVPWLPGVVFAFLCLSVPLLVKSLPETDGYELPQTVDEIESNRRPWKSQTAPRANV